jgi:hypothetical protein
MRHIGACPSYPAAVACREKAEENWALHETELLFEAKRRRSRPLYPAAFVLREVPATGFRQGHVR